MFFIYEILDLVKYMVKCNRIKAKKVIILALLILISFTFFGCREKIEYKYERVDKREKIIEISDATYTTNQNIVLRNNKKDIIISKFSIKFTKMPDSVSKYIYNRYNATIHIVSDKEYVFKASISDWWSTDAFRIDFFYEKIRYGMLISFRKDRVILQTKEHIKHSESGDGIYYDDLFLTLVKN